MEEKYEIIKFIDGDMKLDVRFSIDDNTVWLSQNDIANLYKIDISSVSRHVKSIIKNDNLPTSNFAENANYRPVVAKFATVQNEGECQVKRTRNYYNLDINVSPSEDTVWLTQREIATLFDKSISTINEHINNILVDELNEQEVTKFGKTEFASKAVKYYNLDMVLSVGYRVNSKRGIEFRRNEYCRLS